ncbi:hypothetical protein HID58_067393 [Brassica napus]|uniref:Uncharacterized protein n=2 Tax=Brassica TaxID=3705 RepID=A0ABQ7ZII4_BRANA|nr:hypothetical protein HID58_067393 [Brassica napus]
MVNSSIILADLKAGSCSNTVKVRLIRFGEARIVKNGGHLRGVHMLLLNEKHVSLRRFIEVTEKVTIPAEKFRFQKYNQLMALANTNFDLADIMGEVSCINTVFDNENHFIHHNNPIRQDDFNAWLDISTLNQMYLHGLHCSFLESMVREPPVYEVPECPPVTRRRDHDEAF